MQVKLQYSDSSVFNTSLLPKTQIPANIRKKFYAYKIQKNCTIKSLPRYCYFMLFQFFLVLPNWDSEPQFILYSRLNPFKRTLTLVSTSSYMSIVTHQLFINAGF